MPAKDHLRDERGSALVITLVTLPLLLVMAAFAVDVASWFVHDRHLQTRADAAVLAAIAEVRFPACSDSPTVTNAKVLTVAKAYAGLGPDPATAPPRAHNRDLGSGQPDVRMAGLDGLSINQATYFDQPSNPDQPDGTDTRQPCAARAVDVKLTDVDPPWYFKVFKPSFINAHARAELRTQSSAIRLSPIGVENPTPLQVRVWVIDETRTGCTAAYTTSCVVAGPTGSTDGTVLTDPDGDGQWANAAGTLQPVMRGVGSRLGVVAALSARRSLDVSESLTTACTQSLVTCYDAGAAAAG